MPRLLLAARLALGGDAAAVEESVVVAPDTDESVASTACEEKRDLVGFRQTRLLLCGAWRPRRPTALRVTQAPPVVVVLCNRRQVATTTAANVSLEHEYGGHLVRNSLCDDVLSMHDLRREREERDKHCCMMKDDGRRWRRKRTKSELGYSIRRADALRFGCTFRT